MNRFALALLVLAPLPSMAATFASTADSRLTFAGTYQGEAFDGRFKSFTATLDYDAANVAATKIAADIDMTSADTANEERDATLPGDEFFAAEKFPKAHFEATDCTGTAPTLTCQAKLTIRDKTQSFAFPVTLTPAGSGFRLDAKTTLKRSAFDVGTGDWADTELIADDVPVTVAVTFAPK